MRIYISGDMDHEEAEANCLNAGSLLESMGLIVVDPFSSGMVRIEGNEKYLTSRLKLLLDCDAVLMLRNWQSSTEARIEHQISKDCGKMLLFESVCSEDHLQQIKDAIRVVTSLEFEEYTTRSRKSEVYYARLIFATHCLNLGEMDYKEIAKLIHRDHTSIARYEKILKEELKFNPKFRIMNDQVERFLDLLA